LIRDSCPLSPAVFASVPSPTSIPLGFGPSPHEQGTSGLFSFCFCQLFSLFTLATCLTSPVLEGYRPCASQNPDFFLTCFYVCVSRMAFTVFPKDPASVFCPLFDLPGRVTLASFFACQIVNNSIIAFFSCFGPPTLRYSFACMHSSLSLVAFPVSNSRGVEDRSFFPPPDIHCFRDLLEVPQCWRRL